MPHCIIGITNGIIERTDTSKFLIDVSKAINTDNIFESDDIKTRIQRIDDSVMGELRQNHSIVTAEIVLLDNKTENQKQRILSAVQDVLISYFENQNIKFSITSRLTLVNPSYYRKHINY